MAKVKTFASGQPLAASDVNEILNPEVPTGATTVNGGGTIVGPNIDLASSLVERRGEMVYLYGAVTLKAALTLSNGGGFVVGTVSPPPVATVHATAPTQSGPVELLIEGNGQMTIRNWSGGSMGWSAGAFIGLGMTTYRAGYL